MKKELAALSINRLADVYNKACPGKPIKKFSDRNTAQRRTLKALEACDPGDAHSYLAQAQADANKAKRRAKAKEAQAMKGLAQAMKAKATKAKATKAKATRGQLGITHPDNRFFKTVTECQQREGSLSAASWPCLRGGGSSYNAYIDAGGRYRDLRYWIYRGWVRVERNGEPFTIEFGEGFVS